MSNIVLYRTNSDEHELNKVLTQVGTFSCKLKAPVDQENIEVNLGTDATGANYGYVEEYGRYYYLHPTTQNNSMVIYSGKSDPLMSFKGGVLAAPAVIARNPWSYDKYIPDNKLPVESRTVKGVIKFPGTHFAGNNNTYILTTVGGAYYNYPDEDNNGGE